MKKRLFSLLLALTMLCVSVFVTGCGKGNTGSEDKTAFEVINAALEKTRNLDSVAAQMKMEINLTSVGISMSVPMTIEMKAKGLKSANPVVSLDISMAILGQNIEFEMYQEDNWMYVVWGEMKYKSATDDTGSENDYAENFADILQKIPEAMLKDVEMVKAADGSQTTTISFPAEVFADIYDDFIENVNAQTGTDMEEMQIKDAVAKITVANGYVTSYDLSFTMEITMEGITSSAEATAAITYENPGQAVTITPPEGYQSFEVVTGDLLG